jgi:recombination protein RecA
MGRKKGGHNKLSKESKKKVLQGLKEAKEGKLIPENELVSEKLLEERKKECIQENEHSQKVNKRGRPRKNIITEITKEHKNEIKKENIIISPEQQDHRDKLNATLRDINKEFNDPNMVRFANTEPPKESINFGIKSIDDLLGGGAVIGNFIVIYGSEGTGKSTLAYYQIAEAQRQNKICAYIDLEHSFTKERASQFGIKLDDLILIENCETAEDAMNISIKLSKEKCVDLIILDSINAMSPHDEQYEGKVEKERKMEKEEMALLAKKLGKFLRRVAPFIYKGRVAYLLIGQVRTEGIGGFATREGLSGGHGIKHWSMLTVYIRKGQGTDAPIELIETDTYDEKGKKIKEKKKIGFDCVLKIDKSKKTTSKPELTDLHIPYYFKTGFYNE